MAFTLGGALPVKKHADGSLVWPTFTKAWPGTGPLAAKNCHRAGLGDRRNKITAALFEEAAARPSF